MGENGKDERLVMETPDRSNNSQIAKFEESPVFNFLNSLSPIRPVKSVHITQTINPLSFASLPSVFTSPHRDESRSLQRHQLSDPSRPEFCGDEDRNVDANNVNADATEDSTGEQRSNEGVDRIDQSKEAAPCEWDNLIIFESPDETDSYKKSIGSDFYTSLEHDVESLHSLLDSGQRLRDRCEQDHLSTRPREGLETMQNLEDCDVIPYPSLTNNGEEIDYEHLSGFYRGMRRRCLVFEMPSAQKQCLDEDSGNASSSDDQKPVSIKAGNGSSRRVLPGIGLHLNALATTPKDYKIVNHDSSTSGRLLIGPGLSVNFHPSTSGSEPVSNVVPITTSSDMEIDCAENAIVPMNEANEDMNQSSPKKKRRRMDGEVDACKRCNCKKSKCLKLYCECFAAGVYCVEPCACIDCFNKPIHEDTVLATRKQIESRNPLAFAPKVIRTSDTLTETRDDPNKTPASARHKRGCNCKKSGCLKKYCECYQGGVGCSVNCRCEGCKNAFGRKEGTEADVEEDETDMIEKGMMETYENCTMDDVVLDQDIDSVSLATPQRLGRQSVRFPFSSNKKPPRSFPSMGSSSGTKSRYFQNPNKLDNGDEVPDFLQGETPNRGIKLSSPNQKRVSPPHRTGMSGSGRRLILQSVPSFPSLGQNP